MKLTELYVYPVKSLRGHAVDQWKVDEFGLQHDRRWMVVDENSTFLTQRELPRMTLITPRLGNGGLQLAADGMSELTVTPNDSTRLKRVQIWNDTVDAEDCGAAAAEWLSEFLQRAVSLVYMPDETFRRVNPNYSPQERRVSFADGYPVLLITQESLDGLNRRLEQPIEMRRFRPNVVVSGAPYAHAEDEWKELTIGALSFDVVKPCERCAIPTVDPWTGERGKEPNRTLATYRRIDGKVYFGQNLIHRQAGSLSVGDGVIHS